MSPTSSTLQRYLRYVLTAVGKIALRLLTRTSYYGAERVPARGPFIIAGNHRAVMEIFLMLTVTRPQVDIIGAGDFPLDPSFRFLAKAYGYIPYRRGSVDGRALRRAQRVLEAGGVVGIFPEGGIWTDGPKDTQRGVAWLAAQTGAPVVPMGFAGIDDGVARTFALSFPRFEVHVGTPISLNTERVTRTALDEFSKAVMAQVDQLLPDWDRAHKPRPAHEQYALELRWNSPRTGGRFSPESVGPTNATGESELRVGAEGAAIARFYHLPVLLSIFEVNLRRDISALKAWDEPHAAGAVATAVERVLGYLALRNKYLFSYRLGAEQATVLEAGLGHLRDWLHDLPPETLVQIVPIRRTTWPDGRTEELRAPAEGS